MTARNNLKHPYWATSPDIIESSKAGFTVGDCFNKTIAHPGTNPDFPDGVIGVYLDGNFWAVAALPYDKYLNVPIQDIVKKFWPEVTNPEFGKDYIESKHD